MNFTKEGEMGALADECTIGKIAGIYRRPGGKLCLDSTLPRKGMSTHLIVLDMDSFIEKAKKIRDVTGEDKDAMIFDLALFVFLHEYRHFEQYYNAPLFTDAEKDADSFAFEKIHEMRKCNEVVLEAIDKYDLIPVMVAAKEF